MTKREHRNINGSAMNEGSRRSKRRREFGDSSSDVDIIKSDLIEPGKSSNHDNDQEQVRERGFMLYAAVADAVNEDGVPLSTPFEVRVPKKHYPDYYKVIKQPIALQDIKKKLDHQEYSSLLLVRNDFELLFSNARQYNQTESVIFQAAQKLWKLVQKTYDKLVASNGESEISSSLNHLMTVRLDKLMNKKDSTGRVLCIEFIHLPSKKDWAVYYKTIKNPQCLDTVAKKLKRREYYSPAQFAADVELIFSNALTFNQDHTTIWNDAVTLRDYFRQLMSDMPHPYGLSEYAKYSMNKIKIKPAQVTQAAAMSTVQSNQKQEAVPTPPLTLRVPAAHPPTRANPPPIQQLSGSSQLKQIEKVSAVAEKPTSPPKPPKPQSKLPTEPKGSVPPPLQQPEQQRQEQAKAATPQSPVPSTVSFINATPSHYPRTPYAPPPPPTHTPNSIQPSVAPPVLRPSSALTSYPISQSPAPTIYPLNRQLKSISLRIHPKVRNLTLDHRDGVKSWAIRLATGESNIVVSSVTFLGDHDEDMSSAEEDDAEKDEDYEMDVDESATASPNKNGRRKGKGRGRGRPAKGATKAVATRSAKIAKKKVSEKVGEVQLKLNNFVVKEQPENEGEWNVYLPIGMSTIEIGEVGGMIWKIYTERLSEA